MRSLAWRLGSSGWTSTTTSLMQRNNESFSNNNRKKKGLQEKRPFAQPRHTPLRNELELPRKRGNIPQCSTGYLKLVFLSSGAGRGWVLQGCKPPPPPFPLGNINYIPPHWVKKERRIREVALALREKPTCRLHSSACIPARASAHSTATLVGSQFADAAVYTDGVHL